jgi:hypothetical protein
MLQADNNTRAKAKELERVQKLCNMLKASEFEMSVKQV